MLPAMSTARPGTRAGIQALGLIVAGGLLGLAVNVVRDGGLPLDRPILAAAETDVFACQVPDAVPGIVEPADMSEALSLFTRGAAFVDARGSDAFASGHVAGAFHLQPAGACQEADVLMDRLLAAPAVVVYGAGGEGARALASELAGRGLPRVQVMTEGFDAWLMAGKPAMSGPCHACLGYAYGGSGR
jgi:thiosulfate sulfurtransferase